MTAPRTPRTTPAITTRARIARARIGLAWLAAVLVLTATLSYLIWWALAVSLLSGAS